MMRLFRQIEASAALAMPLVLVATFGTAAAQEFAGREKLRAHSDEFRREVIKITDGVWVAVGLVERQLGVDRRQRLAYLSAAQYLLRDLPAR